MCRGITEAIAWACAIAISLILVVSGTRYIRTKSTRRIRKKEKWKRGTGKKNTDHRRKIPKQNKNIRNKNVWRKWQIQNFNPSIKNGKQCTSSGEEEIVSMCRLYFTDRTTLLKRKDFLKIYLCHLKSIDCSNFSFQTFRRK